MNDIPEITGNKVTLRCLLKVIIHDIRKVGAIFKSILYSLMPVVIMSIPAILHLIVLVLCCRYEVVDLEGVGVAPIIMSSVIIGMCIVLNLGFFSRKVEDIAVFDKLFEVVLNIIGISFLLSNSFVVLIITACVMVIGACSYAYWRHVCDVCKNK